jgi:NADP-dependent 3-hydroxy acid dehydrogenase YdfG
MNGWSKSLRLGLQPDIRVIVIDPGAVATELTSHITNPTASVPRKRRPPTRTSPPETSPKSLPSPSAAPQRVALSEILVRPTAQAL